MIRQLTGTIISKGAGELVLDVHDVGYQVFITLRDESVFPAVGESATVFTYHYIREAASDLYGFSTPEELSTFEMLLLVNGVGPKAGMNILSKTSPSEIYRAITSQDVSILTKISGIGKKTAERVVLELKNKVNDFSIATLETGADILPPGNEAMDALVALGCSKQEAEMALKKVMKIDMKIEDQVKEALKYLGTK
jgi:Holliday junction DNA helicase RuvA